MNMLLRVTNSLILIIGCLLFSQCSQAQKKVESQAYELMLKAMLSHSVVEVNVEEVLNDSTIVFLDARTKKEYEVSHIKNAIWVGYDEFKKAKVGDFPKNQKMVVYCSVGYRSEKIAERLQKAGYENVSNLYGGIFEWKNQDGKVYDDHGITENVHAFDKTWGIWLNEGEKVY